MSENALRKSMKACNLCNIALVEEVHTRKAGGEKALTVCKDLEDFQRQMMGEVVYTAKQLLDRYRYHTGIDKKFGNSENVLEDLAGIAQDPEVQAKVESFHSIPPEKPEPVVEPVPVVKTASDFAEDVRRGLVQLNSIVTQRGHGL
jgi:hypothetical protein